MGMLESGNQLEPRSLLTIDEFEEYMTVNSILEMGIPAEKISNARLEDPNARLNFMQIFHAYNDNNTYTHLVEAHAFRIPEFSKQTFNVDSLNKIIRFCNEKNQIECIFIDGAKSYHALYFILTELANSIRKGTTLIFQDYLKLSCWWIPLIVGLLEDYFEITSIVDSTVALFCTKDLLNKTNVLELLPPEASMLSRSQISGAFSSKISQTVSSYSKKHRVTNLVQELACLSDVDFHIGLKGVSRWMTSASLFPRTFSFLQESREALKGRYNQK